MRSGGGRPPSAMFLRLSAGRPKRMQGKYGTPGGRFVQPQVLTRAFVGLRSRNHPGGQRLPRLGATNHHTADLRSDKKQPAPHRRRVNTASGHHVVADEREEEEIGGAEEPERPKRRE